MGVFGLAGVIVGGVLNGVVAAGVERVRDARQTMVTARLVQSDIVFLEANIRAEIDGGEWRRLTKDAPPLAFEAWAQGRQMLASGLDYEEWAAVEVAARQALRRLARAPMNPKPPGTPLTDAEKADLSALTPDLEAGRRTLNAATHGERVPKLWRAMRL